MKTSLSYLLIQRVEHAPGVTEFVGFEYWPGAWNIDFSLPRKERFTRVHHPTASEK